MVDYRFKYLKNQMSKASELGVSIALIVGPKEMEQKEVVVRNMVNIKQKTISSEELIEEIYKILDQLEEMDSE